MTNNNYNGADVQTHKPISKPSNEIDLQAITTFPHISSEHMSDRIRNKFRVWNYVFDDKGSVRRDKEGNPIVNLERDYWVVMELFTQDFRLGNLNKEELSFVRYNMNLCTDIMTALPETFNKPALLALSYSITANETSHGKNGFLRRMFNSIFSHSTSNEETPTKRSFFGLGKKNKME